MSKRYTGNFISGTPQVPTLTSNNGVFDIKDVYTAVNNSAWQEPDSYYEIGKSLRLRSSVGAYLSKTFAADGNRKTWTWSFWVKRGKLGDGPELWSSAGPNHPGGADIAYNGFNGSDQFIVYMYPNGGPATYNFTTTRVFRDPSAWYHIVVGFDTTQANGADRIKIYVNGVQETSFSTQTIPSQNYASSYINSTRPQVLGHEDGRWRYPFDGHLAEWYFIDGQQLDPSYFGYFDPTTNIWQPKKYTGGYGTNGFYLPFNENGSTANIARNFGVGSNLISYSEQFNSSPWTTPASPTACTVTANQISGPFDPSGVTTADMITFNATNNHPCYQDITFSIPNGGSFVTSMYVKKGTASSFNLQNYHATTYSDWYNQFTFNADGTQITNLAYGGGAADPITVGSTYLGNGWHRVWCIHKNTTGSTQTAGRISIGTNASVGTIYVWGAQAEYGDSVGIYQTTGSTGVNNNWATNNISLTSGTTYDSMVDSPTNVFTTATDVGGVVSGNYATWNSLNKSSNLVLTEASFKTAGNGGVNDWMPVYGTMAAATGGKWYWEYTMYPNTNAVQGFCKMVGIVPPTALPNNGNYIGSSGYGYGLWVPDGSGGTAFNKRYNGTNTTLGSAYALQNGDVIQVAYDASTGQIWFGKNNTWLEGNPSAGTGASYSSIDTSVQWLPALNEWYNSAGMTGNYTQTNFGQRPFTYTPPAGFKSLNTTNLQALGSSAVGNAGIPGSKNMDAVFWYGRGRDNAGSGNNADYDIKGLSFKPDMIWTKNLDSSEDHYIFDSARGFSAYTQISFNKGNSTGLEGSGSNIGTIGTQKATYISKANSDGFTISNATPTGNGGELNYPGRLYDSWCWKQATGVFTMVTYSGNGANRSITHNLGVTPAFMIVKGRDNSGGGSSWVYHKSYNSAAAIDRLDSVGTGANNNSYTTVFNSTAPTSSNFSVGTSTDVNGSGYNYIAYLWAEVPGFSKFGTYVGNSSSDGPFIYCGFRPKFIIIRSVTNSSPNNRDWLLKTSKDNNYNGWSTSDYKGGAQAIIAGAAYTGSGVYSDFIDYTSNGFKIRNAGSPNYNGGETYMYCAWADNPFALNNRAF